MTPRVVGSVVVAALAACTDGGIDPVTRITAPRVLAITSEPSALAVDGHIEMTTIVVDPVGPRIGIGANAPIDGRPITGARMRACAPWKFIADPARDCVGDDAFAIDLDPSGSFVVSARDVAAAFPSPPGVTAPPDPWRTALAAGLKLRLPIIAELDVDGQTLVARRDVDIVVDTGERQNPGLSEIRFDGIPTRTLRAGERYALTAMIDPASLDAPPDGESGMLERVVCNFYSPSGDLAEFEVEVEDPQAPVPETAENSYTAGPAGSTWLFVVATDETGGMTVASVPLTIE